MNKGAWLRAVAIALMTGVLAVAALTARVIHDGQKQMLDSDRDFDRGDLRGATMHARRAAVLYAPGAPHVADAYARLVAIAVGSESAGNVEMAELAWRAVRGAALETRHLWVPHRIELERANQSLARLEARSVASLTPQANVEDVAARAKRELERDVEPRAPWVVVLVLGFGLATIGLALTAVRGVRPDGRLEIRAARLGLLLTVVGVICWALAAFHA
jgi:hypothetical protein